MPEPAPRPFLDSYKLFAESGFLVAPLDGMRPHEVCGGSPGNLAACDSWAGKVGDTTNIGVQIPQGIVVVTVDADEHGPASLWKVRTSRGFTFPHTLCATTPRGGLQIWFYAEHEDETPHTRPLPGVYVTGFPRIVPVPPSVGSTGTAMRWANHHPVADLPSQLQSPLGVRSPRRRPTFVNTLHQQPVPFTDARKLLETTLGAAG